MNYFNKLLIWYNILQINLINKLSNIIHICIYHIRQSQWAAVGGDLILFRPAGMPSIQQVSTTVPGVGTYVVTFTKTIVNLVRLLSKPEYCRVLHQLRAYYELIHFL